MPSSLHEHAADNIRFIRDTMARAAAFTAVPGWGGVVIGVAAIAAAFVIGPPRGDLAWVAEWLGVAGVAVAIGLATAGRKATRSGAALTSTAARRFALAFLPGLVAGAVLTAVVVRAGRVDRLPGCWLLLYGTAVTSGGALSVPVVPVLGMSLMAVGIAALALPAAWGHYFMALGFGVFHIGAGLIIARRYGG